MKKLTRNKIFGATLATAVAGSLISAPLAHAYGGVEDQATGIVWGTGEDGTYMIPTADGELQGFCIDPGKAYPKQGGATQYSAPQPYGSGLDSNQKKMLAVALLIGQSAVDNQKIITDFQNTIKPFAPQIANYSIDELVAGASGVVHHVGDMNTAEGGTGGKAWGEYQASKLQGTSREVYDAIIKYIPMVPDQILQQVGINTNDITFSVRTPADGSNKQRMIALQDIPKIQVDLSKLPDLSIIAGIIGGGTSSTSSTSGTGTGTGNQGKVSTTPVTTGTGVTSSGSVTTKPTSPTTTSPNDDSEIEIRTSAGEKEGNVALVGSTITDTVTYHGVKPGTKYKLVAETVDKETEQLLGNTGEKEFTPESTQGEIDVDIELKAIGEGDIVVFETLYEITPNGGETKVAEHRDVADKAQTLSVPESTPEIRTLAESSTGNLIEEGTVIKDTVGYSGLVKGKEYRLEARLMDKITGAETGAKQEKTFTAEDVAGEVTVEDIKVTDASITEQVVFEKLYDVETGEVVAKHEDITDAAQTIGGQIQGDDRVTQSNGVGNGGQTAANQIIPQDHDTNKIIQNNGEKKKAAPQKVAPNAAMGQGGPAGSPAPRQVIASVPSGGISTYGIDIFNR